MKKKGGEKDADIIGCTCIPKLRLTLSYKNLTATTDWSLKYLIPTKAKPGQRIGKVEIDIYSRPILYIHKYKNEKYLSIRHEIKHIPDLKT